jgi:hypothetical protein
VTHRFAGLGDVKLLKHRDTGKIRLLMRRDKTLKIAANHLVIDDGKGTYNLKEHPSSDRSWQYCAQDFSEGETSLTTFAIRFGSADGVLGLSKISRAAKDTSPTNSSPVHWVNWTSRCVCVRVSGANTFKAKFEECQAENQGTGEGGDGSGGEEEEDDDDL